MNDKQRDIDELADEYVLGLLEPTEHDAVEARLEHDQMLRKAVGASRDRFVELDLAATPAEHSPELWDRISTQIGDHSQLAGNSEQYSSPESTVPPVASNDNARRFWRGTALASMAASLLLAVALAWNISTVHEPRVVAILVNDAGEALAMVEDFGDATARVTTLADFDVPEGKVMQVWTLPSKDIGPVSLGLLNRTRTAVLDGPDLPEPHAGQLYEITLEQAGGSPTGRPTGPILVKGLAKAPRI